MKRRTALRIASGIGVISSPSLGGCLGSPANDAGDISNSDVDYRWKYDAGGKLDTVSHRKVFGREFSRGNGAEADGQVVALDVDTGKPHWTYGRTGELANYTELTVTDGVYFSFCGDDDCSGLYALTMDGKERWSQDRMGGRHSPFVADGVIYVGNDAGLVWAFDTDTGTKRWTYQVPDQDDQGRHPPTVLRNPLIDVGDAVYVNEGALVALNRDDGSTRWRYETGKKQVDVETTISNGTVYILNSNQVTAINDGNEQWSRDLKKSGKDMGGSIEDVESGRLFVRYGSRRETVRLYALDVTTGEQDWVSDVSDSRLVKVYDSVAYVIGKQTRALDAETGHERWSKSVDDSPIQSATVVTEGVEKGHALFVQYDDTELASFTPDGKQTWERSVNGKIESYLVGESVFVGTADRIYALDRQNES